MDEPDLSTMSDAAFETYCQVLFAKHDPDPRKRADFKWLQDQGRLSREEMCRRNEEWRRRHRLGLAAYEYAREHLKISRMRLAAFNRWKDLVDDDLAMKQAMWEVEQQVRRAKEVMTYQQMSNYFGLTPGRLQQIVNKAIRRKYYDNPVQKYLKELGDIPHILSFTNTRFAKPELLARPRFKGVDFWS